jgi:hypothetical protein
MIARWRAAFEFDATAPARNPFSAGERSPPARKSMRKV